MEQRNLGEGFYFTYDLRPNGCGGYHQINMIFNNDERNLHRQITNSNGYFIDFPGVISGSWQEDLERPFEPRMRFMFGFNSFKDGLSEFFWTVQPDGRYYGDNGGFGMEHDVEIVLKSYIDEDGNFTQPFTQSA